MKKLFIFLIIAAAMFAQNKDPQKILDQVKNRFNKVKDYQADVVVKLDMEMVKVPDSKARVYFKQPDKFRIVSEGFSMLPKQATRFSPSQLLNFDYTPVYVRSENIQNTKADVIKVVPNSDTTDVILSTMWVDSKEFVVHKVETSTRRGGTVITEMEYEKNTLPLPTKLKFSFNLGDIDMPQQPSGNQQSNQQHARRTGKLKGSVQMSYSNYIINKGIDDKFFDEKNTPKK